MMEEMHSVEEVYSTEKVHSAEENYDLSEYVDRLYSAAVKKTRDSQTER